MGLIGSLLDEGETFYETDPPLTATAGQTIFTVSFNVNSIFVDSILWTTGYSGKGTNTITFDTGLSEGQEVYLKST